MADDDGETNDSPGIALDPPCYRDGMSLEENLLQARRLFPGAQVFPSGDPEDYERLDPATRRLVERMERDHPESVTVLG